MLTHLSRIRTIMLLGAALTISPAVADVVFTDNTFDLAGYSKTTTSCRTHRW